MTIFRNEEVLSSEYLPELLPHREQQIKQLANNLFLASKKRKPQNTFIYGAPGVGKTAVVKSVFREFEDYAGIKTVYINCWDFKTASAILSKIVLGIGMLVQRRGWAKDEILNRLIEALNKLNKGLIVCLDEVDQAEQEVLYDLLRINQYVKVPVGLIFVSNNPYVFVSVEPRIKSSLAIEEIEFKSYSLQEMKDILLERARLAFTSIEESAVLLAANHAVKKGGDVRVGLQALIKAGRTAEQESANKVRVEHIRKILSEVLKAKPQVLKEKISDTERIILDILEDGKFWKSGALYAQYCKKIESPISERNFRNYVNHLVSLGLIKIRKRKVAGSIRIISKAGI